MPNAIKTEGWELFYDSGTVVFNDAQSNKWQSPTFNCNEWHRVAIFAYTPAPSAYVYLDVYPVTPDGTSSTSMTTVGGAANQSGQEIKITNLVREVTTTAAVVSNYFNQSPMPPCFYVKAGAANGAVSGYLRVYGIRKSFHNRS